MGVIRKQFFHLNLVILVFKMYKIAHLRHTVPGFIAFLHHHHHPKIQSDVAVPLRITMGRRHIISSEAGQLDSYFMVSVVNKYFTIFLDTVLHENKYF